MYHKPTPTPTSPPEPLVILLKVAAKPLLSSMDPLLVLGRCLKSPQSITLHDHSGTEVSELPQCVYIKLGNYIFPRDAPTNFRSKRGAGDFYPLDAVWFMLERKEGSYGEYMQEARRNGVGVVSLVDRKDLVAYLEEEQRPEDCQFVDTLAPLPIPRRTFGDEEVEQVWEEPTKDATLQPQIVPSKRIKTRPAKARDNDLLSKEKEFSNVLELALKVQKSLTEVPAQLPSTSAKHPISLMEQITTANKPIQKQVAPSPTGKEAIVPIVIVPATSTALLTMYNVKQFLEDGHFMTQSEAKSQGRPKESSLFFEHKFPLGRKIRLQVVDNPTRLSSSDWDRVAAVFVLDNLWQFKGWKWDSPVELFQHVKGFVLDFDDKGVDEKIAGWNVTRLTINRSRRHLDSNASFQFWSKIEDHLKTRRFL